MGEFSDDPYGVTAKAYDVFNLGSRAGQLAALGAFGQLVDPQAGPVLDIGAGSGLNVAWLLENLPGLEIVALEPSGAMRSLALAKVTARREWFARATIRPEDFVGATLPPRISGAVMLGVLGHFDAVERAAVFAELRSRLPAGGAVLFDLQAPQWPQRIEAYEFTIATLGELAYCGIAEAWPVDLEIMGWKMTYLTVEGERVVDEATAEFFYRHMPPEAIEPAALEAGFVMEPSWRRDVLAAQGDLKPMRHHGSGSAARIAAGPLISAGAWRFITPDAPTQCSS